jgi:RNA polymerase sigma-70 factor (ECF subfamily)
VADTAFGDRLVPMIPGLLRYALSMTRDQQQAEDLVSDTLVRALERSGTFREESSLATWLHRILHNLAVDRFRQEREVPAEDIADLVEQDWRHDAYTVDAAVVVARAETRDEMLDALIRLPFVYRSAVVLHDAHGLTSRQVAEVQDTSLPAAKQRLRRGRMMLVSAPASGAERRAALAGVPLGCWEARSKVSDYLDDELAPKQRALVEGHLDSCPTCPPLYASLVGARTALHDLNVFRDPDSVIPPEVVERLRTP